MAKITARCTQCGHKTFGDPSKNNNCVEYTVPSEELTHGTGRSHGTEVFDCPTCQERTVHNRCGPSVPRSDV